MGKRVLGSFAHPDDAGVMRTETLFGKLPRQEHQTFIDRFIALSARITNRGHQIKLKIYKHHFYSRGITM
jgi:hypothetical protein